MIYQGKTTICMATNEMQNGCRLSIEAVLDSNHKRRCVLRSGKKRSAMNSNEKSVAAIRGILACQK
jgi:hypothetical protein